MNTGCRGRTSTPVEGSEVDFVWRDARLIVEVDGYRYHREPSAFEDDRERDVKLVLAGWRVLRFTWTQITTRAAWVARSVTGAHTSEEEYNHQPGEPPIAGET